MRSAEFDREEVLRKAIKAFSDKGYTKTSMQDLKAATGLHPGSIYCAFESKKGLMLAAIAQYEQDKGAAFSALFENSDLVLDGLLAYLKQVVLEVTENCAEHHKACFTQKALSELSDNEPEIEAALRESLNAWQAGFFCLFERALENGELDNTRTVEQRVNSLIMGIFGLRTFAQTNTDLATLNDLATQLHEDVCR